MTPKKISLIVSALTYDRAIKEAKADEIINLTDYDHSLTKALRDQLKDFKTIKGFIFSYLKWRTYRFSEKTKTCGGDFREIYGNNGGTEIYNLIQAFPDYLKVRW